MTTNRTAEPYPAERRERAVRRVREHEAEHPSPAAAIRSVGARVVQGRGQPPPGAGAQP